MKTGKVLHILLAVLTIIYLTGHILLNNKNIQQKAAVHVVKIAKSAFGTEVTAGRVQLAYPIGIKIENLTVFDLSNDTLAHAASVSLRLKPLQLIRNKLSITSVRLHSPKVFLSKDSTDALPNYTFLTGHKTGGNNSMTFRANSVLIRNGSVRYDIKDAEYTDSIFNPKHIGINGLIANLSIKSVSSDSIAFIVRKLAFSEQSGFKLSRAKGALTVGQDFTHLTGFVLSTPCSQFEIAELMAHAGLANRPEGIPDFETMFTASVTGSDFKAFIPQTSGMVDPVTLKLSCSSKNRVLNLKSLQARDRKRTLELNSNGIILTGTDPLLKGCRNAKVYGSFSENLPLWLESQLEGFGFRIPDQCKNLGNGTFSLSMTDESGKLDSRLSINCQAGILDGELTGVNGLYQAILTGTDIMLDSITGYRDLGRCNLTANASLTKTDQGLDGTYNADISSIFYRKYEYRNIAINGNIAPGMFTTNILFSDHNGQVALDAALKTGVTPSYELNLSADDINLTAYNLVKDSIIVSTRLHAQAEGSDIDRIHGKLTIDDLNYTDNQGSWHMDNLTANIGNMNENNRVISVYSDFMTISMVGDYNISSIPYSLSRICGDILPTIGKLVADKLNVRGNTHTNRFVLDAKLDNTELLERVLHYPVHIDDPINLLLSFNDVDSIYYGQLSVPTIEIYGESLSQLNVDFHSKTDTCRTVISGLYGTEEKGITDVNILLLAFADIVKGEYAWTNSDGDISGHVKSLSQFFGYDVRNGLKSMTLIDETDILVKGIPWHIDITDIRTDMGKIAISGLDLSSDNQYLLLDGIISADSADVVKLSIQNIDLESTLSRLHLDNIRIGGIASGNISFAGIMNKPSFQGSLSIDDFSFLDAYYGHLNIDCFWDEILSRVTMNGKITEPGVSNTAVSGFYVPKSKTIDINIDANHTDLYFLNLWTSSVFREITGRCVGNFRIFGNLPDMDMEGHAIIENAKLDQKSVNTAFYIDNDTLWFTPGQMRFTNVDFSDKDGHPGVLNCILTHDHFSDWRVNMSADVDNMLVYRQQDTEKSNLNAVVYAQGYMNLTSDNYNGLNIYVDAKTAPGTRLGISLNSSSVEDYNFLTIVDREKVTVNDNALSTESQDTPQKQERSKFNMDLNIECSEDAMIDMTSSSLTGYMRGIGNVSVRYNSKDGTILNGIYNLRYGQCSLSFEDLLRKNFTLMDDSYVRFNGAPMETELNVKTYHNVNSVSIYDLDPSASSNNKVHVRCLMDITGQVSDPQLSFDIDMPNGSSEEKAILASATATEEQRNKQFMYLLTIGRFYTFDVAAMNNGLTPSAMESLVNSTVSGQINNLLSQVLDNDKVSISSNLSASSYLSNDATNLNNKELEGILEARLLNNRLLLNGNFGYRENTYNNTSNFIGDFEFKYLLLPDKNGKGISIIGYNKANDKYFSKTSLTTQGVGLIFEKDF